MSIADVRLLFEQHSRRIPESYVDLLNHPEVIPQWFRSDVYSDPAQIIELNEELRTNGFFSASWPDEFIALGSDPGGNVYFTNARDERLRIFLANHELLGAESIRECSELSGDSFEDWLSRLRELNAQIEKETPYVIFAAGQPEFERLRADPTAGSLEALFWARARPYCALSSTDRARISASLFDSFFMNLEPYLSFDLVGPAADLAVRQDDACLFRASLELLAEIAKAAGTSEVPSGLDRNWAELLAKSERYDLQASQAWSALERQYRRRR